jgi:hypothetical protein
MKMLFGSGKLTATLIKSLGKNFPSEALKKLQQHDLIVHAPPDAESALQHMLVNSNLLYLDNVKSKDFYCSSHFLQNVMLKPFLQISYLQVFLSHS